ncbi:MAG: diguanylate cyclase, partial [Cytophagaceae bacterium]
ALLAKSGILRILGQDAEAIQIIKHCREIYQQTGEKAQEMRAMMNLSILYKQSGDIAASQELLYECLPFFEQAGQVVDTAKVLLNIATNYNVLRNMHEAIPFAERGIALFEASGDHHNLSMAWCVLGASYLKLEQYEAALIPLRKGLCIAEKMEIRWTIAIILGDIGYALMHLGRFDEARDAVERCVAINSSHENRFVYCGSIEQLGILLSHPKYPEKDLNKALIYLLEARQIAEEQDTSMVSVFIYKALSEIYEEQGNFKAALESFYAYHAAQERLFNAESDKRIKQLQTQFEVEKAKKDAEIAHLRSVELAAALVEAERLRALADTNARTDTLTGVENRRALDERLTQEFARARRNNRPLTIALLDIDHFKKINDTFGHSVGDGALRHLTTVLRSQSRVGDYIARYGGEEFALLFPETELATAMDLCERLRVWVAASAWNKVHPGMHQVTMS